MISFRPVNWISDRLDSIVDRKTQTQIPSHCIRYLLQFDSVNPLICEYVIVCDDMYYPLFGDKYDVLFSMNDVFPCLVMSSLHPNLGLGQGQDCTVGPVLINGHSPALFSSIQHVDMLLLWWLGECMRMLHWPDQSPPQAGTTVLQAVDDDTWALATHTGINTQMLSKEGVKVKCVITYSLLDNILFLFHLI